jgi:opacity protein-like surface antigen
MKRTLVGIVLAGLYATASAQGYAGAVLGITDYGVDCRAPSPCDKKGNSAKIFAGTQFKSGLVDTERFKLDTVEVGFTRFGGTKIGAGTASLTYDSGFGNVTITAPVRVNVNATALSLAGVGRFLVTPQFTASVKLGVSVVQSTVDRYVGDIKDGSDTTQKLAPYAGLGLAYSVVDNVKLVGHIDYTRFKSDGYKGGLQTLGLGAQIGF